MCGGFFESVVRNTEVNIETLLPSFDPIIGLANKRHENGPY
jgi:hypothetical protein